MKIPIIPSVNFHLLKACNMRCKFCFATFDDLNAVSQDNEQALKIVRALAEYGFRKITFAGGEPTLWKKLPELLQEAKNLGMTTMVVTNGWNLMDDVYWERFKTNLDWLILSCDSVTEACNESSGRVVKGKSMSREDYAGLCNKAKTAGIKLKINTVVSRQNHLDDMTSFISEVEPLRWKIFKALPVDGQNDKYRGAFEISDAEYQEYLSRHSAMDEKLDIVPEDNDAMTGSYVMVSPEGTFFDNTKKKHTYSDPILTVGIEYALRQVSIDVNKFYDRGGDYSW